MPHSGVTRFAVSQRFRDRNKRKFITRPRRCAVFARQVPPPIRIPSFDGGITSPIPPLFSHPSPGLRAVSRLSRNSPSRGNAKLRRKAESKSKGRRKRVQRRRPRRGLPASGEVILSFISASNYENNVRGGRIPFGPANRGRTESNKDNPKRHSR